MPQSTPHPDARKYSSKLSLLSTKSVVSLVVFGDEDVVTARREGSVRLDSDSPTPVIAVDDPPVRVQPHVDDRLPQAVDPPVALKPLVAEAVGEDLRIQQARPERVFPLDRRRVDVGQRLANLNRPGEQAGPVPSASVLDRPGCGGGSESMEG